VGVSNTARRIPSLFLLLGLAAFPLGVACVAPLEGDLAQADEDALRSLTPDEILGTLAYGQTSAPVGYTKTPLYRAFRFEGKKGDQVEAWVRSSDGDARAWLLRGSFGTIASNLDAAPGTKDARVEATLGESGTFYIVFRETAKKNATFTVSLAKLGGGCALAPAITPTWEATGGRPLGHVLFDSARNRFVTLTAQGTSERVAGGWSPAVGDPLPPGRRTGAAIAYDAQRGRAVLFGGTGDGNELLGDTWEWDGATDTWTEITPPGLRPRGRRGHALAYDAARKKVVLYGGIAGTQTQDYMTDTWTWDGASWERVATAAAPHPEPRTGHYMAFDEARGRVVLYGQHGPWIVGRIGTQNTSRGNTWEWDGERWEKKSDQGAFSSGETSSRPMAYDTRRGRVVRVDLTGQQYGKSFVALEWDGATWSNISGSAPGPKVDVASATSYGAGYDPTRGRFVLTSTGHPWKTQELFFFEEPNRAPVLAQVPDQRVFAGDTLSVRFSASDADGHPVRYALSPMPAGAQLDEAQGVLSWTPSAGQAGSYAVVAEATDGCAASTRSFTIVVEHLGYADLPTGPIAVGGTVQVPVQVKAPQTQRVYYEAWPKLSCTVTGENPGKVAVTCSGTSTQATAYQSASYYFTPPPVTAPLESDLTFSLRESTADANAARTFKGSLEPLSDGTYKLHINAYSVPLDAQGTRVSMRTEPPYGTTNAYGILDVLP
jgi:hypothetical protein